jgi:hypothetical protein
MEADMATGRPVKYSPELIRDLLDAMVREPHTGPKKVAKKHGISPATFYDWQRQSAEHEKAGIADSPWLIEWLGNASWFHRHCQFCRAVTIAQIDARIIESAVSSRMEPLFNPQTGQPFWIVDAKIAADAKSMNDAEWSLEYGSADHERDRADIYERDSDGKLIQATKETPPDPRVLLKAAASLLPGTYGEHITHTVSIGGVLRIGSSSPPPTPALPPPVDVSFITVDDIEAPPATNVLAVAEKPTSVQDFEETFGGRRLVECVYFFDETGKLLPPLDGIVIVAGSSADRLYNEAGIQHTTTPASDLIREGYCNDFLLRMATPADQTLVDELRAKLKAGVPHPLPTHGPPPADDVAETIDDSAAPRPQTPVYAARRIDGERIGYGRPAGGGRSIIH